MTSSIAIMVTSAHARHVSSAEVASAEAAHVASAEAATAEATHVTSAETTAAAVSTATAATAACLCTRRKQTPGKQGGCQYHHRSSSSHDIFLSTGRAISDH